MAVLYRLGRMKTTKKVDRTLVDYVADTLVDHLSGVTIGSVDRTTGTMRLISGSTGSVHILELRRVR